MSEISAIPTIVLLGLGLGLGAGITSLGVGLAWAASGSLGGSALLDYAMVIGGFAAALIALSLVVWAIIAVPAVVLALIIFAVAAIGVIALILMVAVLFVPMTN